MRSIELPELAAEVFVKALRVGHVLLGDAEAFLALLAADQVEVPFTDLSGDVTGGLEAFGNGQLFERERTLVVILDAEALLVTTGEDAGAGGHALRGSDVAAREADAIAGHRIKVRCPDVLVRALGSEIRPAVVVRIDQDDIRLVRGDGRERSEQ